MNKLVLSNRSFGLNRLEEILPDIKRLGFSHVELPCEQTIPLALIPESMLWFEHQPTPNHEFGLPDYKSFLQAHNVVAVSINANCELCHPKSVEILRKRIDVACLFGASLLSTGIGQGGHDDGAKKLVADHLRMACRYARQYGATVCLRTDAWLVSKSNTIMAIIEDVGYENLRIDFDPAHMLYYDDQVDLFQYLSEIVQRVGYVRIRGSTGKQSSKIFPALGSQAIDYKRIFQIVNAHGFFGPFCLDLEDSSLWAPDSSRIPLTHSYWQTKKYDEEALEMQGLKIRQSLDVLEKLTSIEL